MLRNGPVRLNHNQAVALAGDVYRFGMDMPDDPDLSHDNAYRDEEVEALGEAIRAAGLPARSKVVQAALKQAEVLVALKPRKASAGAFRRPPPRSRPRCWSR